jgi:3-hydroxyacyl-CoA dehydrogenase
MPKRPNRRRFLVRRARRWSKPATWKTISNLLSAGADFVLEVIVENLKIKQSLMERIDAARKPGSIIASNTSGIPLKDIAAGRSEDFRQHFLGMHFFNPPRYLKLLEVIPTADTLPDVVSFISHFGEYRLGKGLSCAKTRPTSSATGLPLAPALLRSISSSTTATPSMKSMPSPAR